MPTDGKPEQVKASQAETKKGSGSLNRKQRREMQRQTFAQDLTLEVMHPDAAGIDIGGEYHYVAVPPSRDPQPVRRFHCVTAALQELAAWLKQCRIRTVAIQSTGVHSVPVYDLLEEEGMEVYLVNPRQTKNLPGRKTDVQECQWLLQLHTYGLLRNSFRPTQEVQELRDYWRQRNDLVVSAARQVHRMQKALTQMNVQLANVISDLSGVTGQAIVTAIVKGERDGNKLAEFRDRRIQASKEEIARSLEGHWKEGQLFVLKQEQEAYEFYQKQIGECDQQLQAFLDKREDRSGGASLPEEKRKHRRKKKRGNAPQFDMREALFRMTGVDVSQIDGIDVQTATTIVSEAGFDMSKWKTEKHFVSWLRLAPDNRVSGDRVIGKGRMPTNNRLSTALKLAASTLRASKTALGAQYRRWRTKLGTPVATKAMAAKLARLIYRTFRYGMKYVDYGVEWYEQQFKDRQIRALKQKAAGLGYDLVEVSAG
jgi:transposase